MHTSKHLKDAYQSRKIRELSCLYVANITTSILYISSNCSGILFLRMSQAQQCSISFCRNPQCLSVRIYFENQRDIDMRICEKWLPYCVYITSASRKRQYVIISLGKDHVVTVIVPCTFVKNPLLYNHNTLLWIDRIKIANWLRASDTFTAPVVRSWGHPVRTVNKQYMRAPNNRRCTVCLLAKIPCPFFDRDFIQYWIYILKKSVYMYLNKRNVKSFLCLIKHKP